MKRKVLILISDLNQGGAERQAIALWMHLRKESFDVRLVYYGANTFYKNLDNQDIIHIGAQRPICKLYQIKRTIQKEKPDAIISFMMVPILYTLIVSPRRNRQYQLIISMRASQDRMFLSKLGLMLRFFINRTDWIVCNSFQETKLWKKYVPKIEKKLKIIYNFIDLPEYSLGNYIPLRDGRLHIVIAARLMPIKNALKVLEALKLMQKESQNIIEVDWYGDMEGNPEYTRLVLQKIKEYSIEKCFKLHPPVENIFEIMNSADMIGLFSLSEGLPNAICEGMCLGKPVIMTRVSDYQLLVDSSNGWLCDADNVKSIFNAFRNASITNIDQLIMRGIASRKKAEQLFSYDVIMNAWGTVISNE